MTTAKVGHVDKVGLVGLGLVGSALAEVLCRNGVKTVGFDIRPEQIESLRPLGVRPAASISELMSECEHVLLALPTSRIVRETVEGAGLLDDPTGGGDGRSGPLDRKGPHDKKGSLCIIDMTTGDPFEMAELAERLGKRGIHYLDASLGGNSEELKQGNVLLMVGGSEEAFAAAKPVLDMLSKSVFHMGESGHGAKCKLIYNLVLGLHRAVLAEALSLGRRSGLDLRRLLEVLRSGSAYSYVMENKGNRMIEREYTPVAKMAQHLKDVRLILEYAHRLGAPVPLSAIHAQLLQIGVSQGMGSFDNAAIFETYLRLAEPQDSGPQAPESQLSGTRPSDPGRPS